MALKKLLISENIKLLMRQAGLRSSELARKIGVKPSMVHRLITGESDNPTLATLQLFANYFHISVGQLLGEVDLSPRWLNEHNDIAGWHPVPLITSDLTKKFILVDSPLSEKAFAMKVIDDNMDPVIPEDAIVVVEPLQLPSNGNFVAIKNGNDFLLKRYIAQGNNKLLLSSINDFSKIEEIKRKNKIFGTVVRIIHGITIV